MQGMFVGSGARGAWYSFIGDSLECVEANSEQRVAVSLKHNVPVRHIEQGGLTLFEGGLTLFGGCCVTREGLLGLPLRVHPPDQEQ